MSRIQIDHDKCVGAGNCAETAPELFDQDEDGLVVVLNPRPPAELYESARDAANICPARVIRLE